MKINTAIRRVMKDKGFTYHMMATALSAAIGKTITENGVGSKLTGGDSGERIFERRIRKEEIQQCSRKHPVRARPAHM